MTCTATNFRGKDVYIQWVYSGGTITLHADYTTANVNPNTDRLDATAGADAAQNMMGGIERYSISVDMFQRKHNDSTLAGTVAQAALKRDVCGTVTVYPEGTATGKRKIILPSISDGLVENLPYNELATWNVNFTQSGGTITYGTA